MNKMFVLGGLLVVGAVVAASALFVVRQPEQALVLRLGAPRAVITEPGLHVKVPFIEDVLVYEKRVLSLDLPAEQVLLADQRRIEVDTFTRFQIEDPLRFYQTVRNEDVARARVRDLVSGSLRRVLGGVMLQSVLSGERVAIMNEIQRQVTAEADGLGINVIDVRIRRADLPEETSQAIFARMQSEREREAREARAQGQERAQQIRARAERERTVLLAEAQRQAQILRGEGERNANAIWARAATQDPEFFNFYRSLQAYRTVFNDDNTSLILSPDGEFFQHFGISPRNGGEGPLTQPTGGR
ncbi:protease modulator HflC [Telmatospirillum sp. J64-1]|uniref:protease modulator HflC n=1 Tax=Telmatospirillum sp. J64-1 TaxID=2502183 RepID=UPI00115DDE82|nr:protease modulator HflC [Telmatospirillum sp. J64-1]